MDRALEQLVWTRARANCEYCQLAQAHSCFTFEIDHIVARKHGGTTEAANLALACFYCNSFKGSNVGGIDKATGRFVQLFNPRRHAWKRHFQWQGAMLVARTPIGRVTIDVLAINNSDTLALRETLIDEGIFPPK